MNVQKKDGVTILTTDERLDALVAPKLKDAVKDLAQESGLKLVIDMKKTSHIDSSGCGALVASLKALVKNHGDMKVARPTPQALTLFQLTRLHQVFEIYDTLEGALKSFA
ncbi:MAG: STAS domain-containing protein [Desulfomonile sp.]|jgi:anti-sigma B factor antagonist|nr:STAS domain-containing protein [Deltaproteobacteria bacterium]